MRGTFAFSPASCGVPFVLETIGALFRMIEEKHRLLDLLTRYMSAGGLTIVIGSEHQESDMHPFSLVASTVQDGPRTATAKLTVRTQARTATCWSLLT